MPIRIVLQQLQNIEENEYQNSAEVTAAAGLKSYILEIKVLI